jgi:hypothetical protein
MTKSNSGFLGFAWSLFLDVVRRPAKVVADLPSLDTRRCLQFGWFCFFISTLVTSLIQIGFASQVIDQLTTDPASYLAISKFSDSFGSMAEFTERLGMFISINWLNLWMSPATAWFFPHLLAGAIFIFLNFLNAGKSAPGTYDQVIKLVSIGQAPLLFCVLPFLGPIIGSVWSFIFIVRAMGSLFAVNALGRLSAACLCFFFLFSIWNSTVTLLATALQQRDWTWML